jgi:asparagine N-glycosylation enzyme membrane subunit Stt3
MPRPYHPSVAAAKRRKRKDAAHAAPEAPKPLSRRAAVFHVAAACLLLVLFASHRYATVLLEKGGRFEDPDAMFHAHRAVRAIEAGTWLPPLFDPYENFPDGGRALWPPLHDATLALLARLGGSTPADPRRGLPVAASLPVIELVLGLLAAAALAKRIGGSPAAAAAAWLFALTPCLPRRGAFGDIDHNLTEVLGALLLLAAAAAIVRREEEPGRGISDPRLSPLLWSGAVLLSLGFYAGLVLSAGVVAAAVAARDLLAPESRALPRISLGFGLAALVLPLFTGLRAPPDPADPWRLGPPYVLVLALGAAGTGLFSLAVAARRGFRKEPDLFAAAGAGAGIVAAFVTHRAAWGALARGFGFLGAREKWLATIDEFQPLFGTPDAPLAALPAVPFALVAVGAVLAIGSLRRLPQVPSLVLLAVPFAAFAALAVAQKRFMPAAAAFAAAAGGAAWGLVHERRAARWILGALFAGSVLAATKAFLLYYASVVLLREATPVVLPVEEVAEAVRSVTPEAGSPPAWGVLAPWSAGHAIVWKANRAVALNNFGNMHPGFARAEGLWLETSPARAVELLSRLKLRFVVASWPPEVGPAAAAALGRDPAEYFVGGWAPDRPAEYRPTPAGERTLLVRLHLASGTPYPDDGPEDRAALARLRLVGASEEKGPGPRGETPLLKVFELRPEAAPTGSR